MTAVDKAWAGVYVGKTLHWVCVVDPDGRVRLSVKVSNDEAQILDVISKVRRLAAQVVWAVDIIGAPSALLLTLLIRCEQVVLAMSAGYTGEGKTDAKDSRVIAETARIRRDLTTIDRRTELVRNLDLLTGHRADLVADRVRLINRLRDVMTHRLSLPGKGFRLQVVQGRAGVAHR